MCTSSLSAVLGIFCCVTTVCCTAILRGLLGSGPRMAAVGIIGAALKYGLKVLPTCGTPGRYGVVYE